MFQDRTMLALNLAVFLIMLGVGMIVPLLPQKLITLEGPEAPVGYVASFFALSFILLQVPVGNLSDRLGFKIFLAAGYLLCALAGLLFYLAHSAGLIFLGRLVQGAGEAPLWALAPALLSIKYPLERGRVMGIYNAVFHLGLTAGPLLGVALAGVWNGNQAFLFYAAVCLAGALVILLGVDDVRTGKLAARQDLRFSSILALAARRDTLAALLGITLYGTGYGIFLTVLPAHLITVKGFSATNVGVFFALFYSAISFSQLSGPLSDRFGRRMFMVAGLVTAAAGLGSFSALGQPLVSVVLALAGLGLGVFFLSSLAFLNEAVPDSLKGTISGAYYLFWGFGMFFGPVLVDRLGKLAGESTGFYIFSLALLLEAALLAAVSGNKSIQAGIGR
ncbi:Predicted arabinose efflux permease, MFS family [Desulfotomaculum arcticum]|uniref:Predicted arabinose efflux permease, MFS family n=1 Tax=Desulfotruncus arcticus DSM 17038 TaxID=1121424 RepID=A0A1I2P259_9FIRM|nr:MFS transporter [Desulfotruncus arcticus]SFG08007.1 Predicted arabinose efflux permease, MFS family [Desulfotomaculum arcticum] [Desulfotruncus arcticus DSM 17038]